MAMTITNVPKDLTRVLRATTVGPASNRGGSKRHSVALGGASVSLGAEPTEAERNAAALEMVANGWVGVSQHECDVLRGISNAFQNVIFTRYQTRAAAKIYTSFVFLLVPLIARSTDTKYLPGFFDPWAPGSSMFAAGVAFFATDIAEWAFLTRLHITRASASFNSSLTGFRELLLGNSAAMMKNIMLLMLYFGFYMFHVAWNSFTSVEKLQYHLQTVTRTMPMDQTLTWEMVHVNCNEEVDLPWLTAQNATASATVVP